MAIYITNVVGADMILDRGVFTSRDHAFAAALERSKETVWKMDKFTYFYGKVDVHVYEITDFRESNYIDEPIKVF